LDAARTWFDAHPAQHVRIIDQVVCTGQDHLNAFLAEIEASGGDEHPPPLLEELNRAITNGGRME